MIGNPGGEWPDRTHPFAAAVDVQGFGACLLLVTVGAAGATLSKTVKIELEVEETDDKDNGTWSDVDDAHLAHAVSGANDGCFGVLDGDDDTVYLTQYRGHQRLLPRRGQPQRRPRHRHAHRRYRPARPRPRGAGHHISACPDGCDSSPRRPSSRSRSRTPSFHARIDHDLENALIATFAAAARQHGEHLTARQFVEAEFEIVLEAFPQGNGPIALPRPPFQAVAAVAYVDLDGEEQTLAASHYHVDTDGHFGAIYPAAAAPWPATRCRRKRRRHRPLSHRMARRQRRRLHTRGYPSLDAGTRHRPLGDCGNTPLCPVLSPPGVRTARPMADFPPLV